MFNICYKSKKYHNAFPCVAVVCREDIVDIFIASNRSSIQPISLSGDHIRKQLTIDLMKLGGQSDR